MRSQPANNVDHEATEAPVETKALPVLPWMRVPISIESGTGISLNKVKGLHPLALEALQACKPFGPV